MNNWEEQLSKRNMKKLICLIRGHRFEETTAFYNYNRPEHSKCNGVIGDAGIDVMQCSRCKIIK